MPTYILQYLCFRYNMLNNTDRMKNGIIRELLERCCVMERCTVRSQDFMKVSWNQNTVVDLLIVI